MDAIASPLEIQIHLTDSNMTRFVQCNPRAAQGILDHVHPDRIFAQRHLVLAGDHSVTVYPCSAVARVDFIMDGFPIWPFHRNVTDVVEITHDEFRARFDEKTMRTERSFQPGKPFGVFGEMELDNGDRIFQEVHILIPPSDAGIERLPLDRNVFFHQLFVAPSLHLRRRGGGAILINPDHLVRMTFYPGPADMPANAWSAEPRGTHW
jgi:hypothetical protein